MQRVSLKQRNRLNLIARRGLLPAALLVLSSTGCGDYAPAKISDPTYPNKGDCPWLSGAAHPTRYEVDPIEASPSHRVSPNAVVREQNRLYIAQTRQQLWVIDLANPSQLRALGSMDLPYQVQSMLVRDQIAVLFVEDNHAGQPAHTTLITLDLRDPQHPKELARERRLGRLSAIQAQDDSVFVKFIEQEHCGDCQDTRGQRVLEFTWAPNAGLQPGRAWFVPLAPDLAPQDGIEVSKSHLAFVSTPAPTQTLESQVHLIDLRSQDPSKAIQTLTLKGWIQEDWQTHFQKGQLLLSSFEISKTPSGQPKDEDALDSEQGDRPRDLRKDCDTLVLRSYDLLAPGGPKESYKATVEQARFWDDAWSTRIEFGTDKALLFGPHARSLRVLNLQNPKNPELSKKMHVAGSGGSIQQCEFRGDEVLLLGYGRPSPDKFEEGKFIAKLLDISTSLQPQISAQLTFGDYKLSHERHRHAWFPSFWRHEDLVFAHLGYDDDLFAPTDAYCEPDKRAQLQLIAWTPGKLELRGRTPMPPAQRHQLVLDKTLINYNGTRLTSIDIADPSSASPQQDLLLDRPSNTLHPFDAAHWLVSHHDTWRNELVIQMVPRDPQRRHEVIAEYNIPGPPNAQCMRSPYLADAFVHGTTAHLWVEGFETPSVNVPKERQSSQWRANQGERIATAIQVQPEARLISIDFQDLAHPQLRASLSVPALRTALGSQEQIASLPGHTMGTSKLVRLGDALLLKAQHRDLNGQPYSQDWWIDLRDPSPTLQALSDQRALRFAGGFSKTGKDQATSWEAIPDGSPDARELRVEMQRYQLNALGQVTRQTQSVSGIPVGGTSKTKRMHLVNYQFESFIGQDDPGLEPDYLDPDRPDSEQPDSENDQKRIRLRTHVLDSNLAYGDPGLDEPVRLSSSPDRNFRNFIGLEHGFVAQSMHFDAKLNQSSAAWKLWMPGSEAHALFPFSATAEHRGISLDAQNLLLSRTEYKQATRLTLVTTEGPSAFKITNYELPKGHTCESPHLVGETLFCATGGTGIMALSPLPDADQAK